MRIAIDSSVLIAAQISRAGACAELLEDVLMHHQLVISQFIVGEVTRKLVDKLKFPTVDVDEVGRFLRRAGTLVEPINLPSDLCRDTNDLPVLGTAVAGECSLLISVDRDLLDMRAVRGIPIIRPSEYWRRTHEVE